ncbi:MAG: hypothetical protein LEGION0398_MBIBDBAK_01119 [Legionellaceae bacterium]
MVSLKILMIGSFGNLTRIKVNQLIQEWSNQLLDIVKLKFYVSNKEFCEYPPNRSIIFMCNHNSLYDIPLIIAALPGSIRMLAKRELFKIPMFGAAMKKAEFISIDRKNKIQAVKDLQLAKAKMQDGIILWIAPEGTRSDSDKLLPLKKGGFILAIQTDAIIIPIGIRGAHHVLPARTLKFNLRQKVSLHIGEPIDATHYTLETKNELMEKVKQSLYNLTSSSA